MNENEIREIFREMREEPVPAESLARVRMGVAGRIGKSHWRRIWVAALAIAGCIFAAFLLRPANTGHAPVTPEIAQVLPPAETPAPPERPVVRIRRPKAIRRRPMEAVPVSIRIETPDPDVVILLVN